MQQRTVVGAEKLEVQGSLRGGRNSGPKKIRFLGMASLVSHLIRVGGLGVCSLGQGVREGE